MYRKLGQREIVMKSSTWSSGRCSNCRIIFQLTIRVSDVNDNAPKFELPDYQAHNVDEDISLGTSILKVKATDADSGANAEIEYLVSDDHFSVDSSGIIVNNKQLDADNNNAYYEFVVTAKDKGICSL